MRLGVNAKTINLIWDLRRKGLQAGQIAKRLDCAEWAVKTIIGWGKQEVQETVKDEDEDEDEGEDEEEVED